MVITKSVNDNNWAVTLSGDMHYGDKDGFHEIAFAFSRHNAEEVILDLSDLKSIDSNGIGMFMILYEDAKKFNKTVKILNLNGKVKTIFQYSEMKNLFNLSPAIA